MAARNGGGHERLMCALAEEKMARAAKRVVSDCILIGIFDRVSSFDVFRPAKNNVSVRLGYLVST